MDTFKKENIKVNNFMVVSVTKILVWLESKQWLTKNKANAPISANMIIPFAQKNFIIIEKTITNTHLSLFKRCASL